MKQMGKRYIGDGVYASFDGFHIILELLNGERICLEDSVYSELKRYGDEAFQIQSKEMDSSERSNTG